MGIVLVSKIDGKQGVEPTRDGLQCFASLSNIADKRGVLGHVGFPGGIKSIDCFIQVAAAAYATHTRCNNQAGLRIFTLENDLEAAEHAGRGPSVCDNTIINGDGEIEVTFHAAQWADMHF